MGGRIRSISSFVNWYTVTWFSMILLSGEITNPRTFGVKAKCFAKQNTRSILKTLLKACLQNHKNVTACETRFQRLDSNASIPTPRFQRLEIFYFLEIEINIPERRQIPIAIRGFRLVTFFSFESWTTDGLLEQTCYQALSPLPPFVVGRKILVAAGHVTTSETNFYTGVESMNNFNRSVKLFGRFIACCLN